jgi:hypothetical protein
LEMPILTSIDPSWPILDHIGVVRVIEASDLYLYCRGKDKVRKSKFTKNELGIGSYEEFKYGPYGENRIPIGRPDSVLSSKLA